MKYLLIISMYIVLSAGDSRVTENTTISMEENTLDDCVLAGFTNSANMEINNRRRAAEMRFNVDKFDIRYKCHEMKK